MDPPYSGQMFTPPPTSSSSSASTVVGFGNDVQTWRETGYPVVSGDTAGYWNSRVPPPMAETGLSRDSSRDDLTSMSEQQVFEFEDRFRVDRRKLELMVCGRFEPIRETPAEFFQRVGEETNTTVIWPSRMKVGAKSKKDDFVPADPHVRVGGSSLEDVEKAKAIILEFLDTKSSRVTMKMDVSYTDHSHIIGKGGNTIRRVMCETSCHVHFPDSNRSNPNEKSNQVSIAGEMDGVERARARVRELTPLIFCFDLPIIPAVEANPDPNDPCVRAIQDQYNVQVTFRQKQKNFHTTIVVVKGCEWEAARVKEATLLLIEHFCCGNFGGAVGSASAATIPVTMNLEISPIHHSVVLGKANINLKIIMQRTKTTILFPDASDPNIPPIRKGSVTVTGMINNVYMARQLLVGSLPLVMMFDLPDLIEIDDLEVQKIQEELDVGISIKPKQRQSNKSVMIKAQERNAAGMYIARHRILGLEGDPVKAEIPETYKLQAVSQQFMNSLADIPVQSRQRSPTPQMNPSSGLFPYPNVNPFTLPGLAAAAAAANFPAGLAGLAGAAASQHLQNYLFPGSLYGAPPIPKPGGPFNPFDQVPPNLYPYFSGVPPATNWMSSASQFTNVLPPNHPVLQDYAMRVLSNITQLQQQQLEANANKHFDHPDIGSSGKGILDTINNNMGFISADDSPPTKGPSPRNSSPVHENVGNLTNQLGKLDITESEKFFDLNSGSEAMLRTSSMGSSPNNSTSGVTGSSGGGGQLAGHKNSTGSVSSPTCSTFIDSSNNNVKMSSDLGQMFLEQFSDRRAPGYEMKTRQQQQLAAQQMDYDQKELLATKAIQSKPTGEPRTPTPSWSGLGFSNSMPESVIRENLELSSADLETSPAGSGGTTKRQNLSLFPNLMNVREETDEEVATSSEKSPFSPTSASANDALTSPSVASATQQHFFRPGWFGNSSAFDVLLNQSPSESEVQNLILPTDDLPSVLAKQGLAKYTDVFLRHEVDRDTFTSLTEQDLKEIGITTFGARKKLILLANKLKQTGPDRW